MICLRTAAAASDEARLKLTEYLATLSEAGETDMHRLTVCGLTYLRERAPAASIPLKAGFTGM